MGIGDYGQNEHKFWFPDVDDGPDDTAPVELGSPSGLVADVPASSLDAKQPECLCVWDVSEYCPLHGHHQFETGG